MREKKYNTIEDFLSDESFYRWVKGAKGHDAVFWDKWVNQNLDKKDLVEEAIMILKGPSFKFKHPYDNPELLQEEWERLKKRTLLNQQTPVISIHQPVKRKYRVKRWALMMAASIAIIVTFAFLIQQYVLNADVTYETSFGKQLSIVLPDSTFLKLNANSKLTYQKKNPRKVWLDGEAYFEVKKKPETGANFLVLTNDLTIEVLGTAFNVVEKEDKTEVILDEGSIKLNLNRDFESELLMKPGEMVVFSTKEGQKLEKNVVASESLTSWKDGVLEFEDVALIKVMERIEEIYGWKAIYREEELQLRKISTPLPSNDLESALTMLRKAIGIEIEKVEEDKILLLY